MAGAVVSTGYAGRQSGGLSGRRLDGRRSIGRPAARSGVRAGAHRRAVTVTARRTRWAVAVGVAVMLGAMFGLLPGAHWSISGAQADSGAGESVAQRVETVRGGDSLWTVAQRAMPGADTRESIDRIGRLNQLHGSDLRPGQQLLIPR